MIYLDSSALLKLLFDEIESDALVRWLAVHSGVPLTTSELARVEVPRACRRANPAATQSAIALLSSLDLIPIGRNLLDEAASIGDATLRSLDAIHLASALSIKAGLSAFVAYDGRLADAASAAGLDCARPGA